MSNISFSYQKQSAFPRNKLKLKRFLNELSDREGKSLVELSYIFCSDDYLLKINQDYLNHEDYTDIITFDYSEGGIEVSGEVYISLDRVKENAHQLNQPFDQELHRVIFHGLLHLCGYKDKLKADRAEMRLKEDFYLRAYYA